MAFKGLNRVCIAGGGLRGGSIGRALRAAGYSGIRVGLGRRASSLRAALDCEAVDEVTQDPAAAASGADLVILCTPIARFEPLLTAMRPHLKPGAYITDVGSTKEQVVRLAERLCPPKVRYVGSHPMAGSEKTGVEFSRADLFELALCLVTPTARTNPASVRWMRRFWETLGARTQVVSPRAHDRLMARVSHLPHAVAAALVHLSRSDRAIDVAGPGFADTTRVASGDAAMWVDILRTNRQAMLAAIDLLTAELGRLRERLERDDARSVERWLSAAKATRDQWIAGKYRKKVLPP